MATVACYYHGNAVPTGVFTRLSINETTKSRSATSLFKTSFCVVQRLSKEHITPDHQDLVAIF
jgi:hypothetical protein